MSNPSCLKDPISLANKNALVLNALGEPQPKIRSGNVVAKTPIPTKLGLVRSGSQPRALRVVESAHVDQTHVRVHSNSAKGSHVSARVPAMQQSANRALKLA